MVEVMQNINIPLHPGSVPKYEHHVATTRATTAGDTCRQQGQLQSAIYVDGIQRRIVLLPESSARVAHVCELKLIVEAEPNIEVNMTKYKYICPFADT